jgi:hypothetical protein
MPVFAYYVLNRAAIVAGSPFYNQQEPNSGTGGTVIGGLNWCSRSVVTGPLLGLVQAHELEHVRVYQEKFSTDIAPQLAALEPKTSTSMSELLDAYDAVRRSADGPARTASSAIHNKTGNPYRLTTSDAGGGCALKNENGQELTNAPS